MIKIHSLSRPRHANGDLSGTQNFFFNDPATTEIYPLSLHDALPIWGLDLVGFLIRISGYKAKSTLCQLDGDITDFGVVQHSSIKLQSSSPPNSQVGIIAKHKPCIAVGRRAHDFIANDFISFRNPRDL